jgi:anaerobic selenocysteine-containing dehydrogenase
MSPVDMASLGLKPDDRVNVTSSSGTIEGVLARPFDIRAGNAAMYYPEANALVPASADAQSKTPAFKNVVVTVRRSSRLPVVRS